MFCGEWHVHQFRERSFWRHGGHAGRVHERDNTHRNKRSDCCVLFCDVEYRFHMSPYPHLLAAFFTAKTNKVGQREVHELIVPLKELKGQPGKPYKVLGTLRPLALPSAPYVPAATPNVDKTSDQVSWPSASPVRREPWPSPRPTGPK